MPAILEYLPYRKGDAFARRDSYHHPYFAGHGYAGVRVDLRGTGDSDGLIEDEYLPQEQEDAIDVIAWLAEQPWCTGAVGMLGISWGGFNGLQVAARRPPALKAVISMCASDDRYADDVHYVGGCVLAVDMLPWAATMLTGNALPPDQAVVGDGWREHVAASASSTRRRSSRPGSPTSAATTTGARARCARTTSAIDVPVYAVGGWADGYSNADPAADRGPARPAQGPDRPVVARLPAGRRARPGDRLPAGVPALVRPAPQGHRDRDHGRAAPARCGCRTAWRRPRTTPSAPGAGCPSRRGRRRRRRSGRGTSRPSEPISHRSIESTGIDAGAWCADGGEGDWPGDQRAEDERSLTFTSAPLDEAIEILGFPEGRARDRGRPPDARWRPCGCATSTPTAHRCSSPAAC